MPDPADTPGAIATRRAAAYAETEPRRRVGRPTRPTRRTAPTTHPNDTPERVAQRRAALVAETLDWESRHRRTTH